MPLARCDGRARPADKMNPPNGREKDPEMKSLAVVVIGTASLVASADAGFLGFVALAKQSGANVIKDSDVAVGNPSASSATSTN